VADSFGDDEGMNSTPTVVGLGEILWDFLPSGRQLGGAPANFAYCSHLLGTRAVVASRIGSDELGAEVRARLAEAGIRDEFVQSDAKNPTGTVIVKLDEVGQPSFEITEGAAWDVMEWTPQWQSLARSADAICFGSLAQRSEQSRRTILNFLDATRPEALRVFDVNLRQKFYSSEIIESSLQRANVVKLNIEEVTILKALLGLSGSLLDETSFCRLVISRFDLKLVCVTHGANGSLLSGPFQVHRHPGFRVMVKDSVGSGDAFTAGLVHGFLAGKTPAEMNDLANRMGAWVASCAGAMPMVPKDGLEQTLMRLGAAAAENN
jgi:fructokinase